MPRIRIPHEHRGSHDCGSYSHRESTSGCQPAPFSLPSPPTHRLPFAIPSLCVLIALNTNLTLPCSQPVPSLLLLPCSLSPYLNLWPLLLTQCSTLSPPHTLFPEVTLHSPPSHSLCAPLMPPFATSPHLTLSQFPSSHRGRLTLLLSPALNQCHLPGSAYIHVHPQVSRALWVLTSRCGPSLHARAPREALGTRCKTPPASSEVVQSRGSNCGCDRRATRCPSPQCLESSRC